MKMDIKPIRTENEYEEALAQIDAIFDSQPGTPEGDLLEVLTILVEAYEEDHYPIAPPDPIEAIEFHMERLGLTRRDLEPFIGSRARVSEILNRRRPLTIAMIRRLQVGLSIPAEILLQRYPLVGEELHPVIEYYAAEKDLIQLIKIPAANEQFVGSPLDLLKIIIQALSNTDAREATPTIRSSATQPGYYPISYASISNRQERILQ